MTGSAPLRWTFHGSLISIEGEESEEREGSGFFVRGKAGGFMLGSCWADFCAQVQRFEHPEPKMKTRNGAQSKPKLASCWRPKLA